MIIILCVMCVIFAEVLTLDPMNNFDSSLKWGFIFMYFVIGSRIGFELANEKN